MTSLSVLDNWQQYSPEASSTLLLSSATIQPVATSNVAYMTLWESLDALYFDALIVLFKELDIFNKEISQTFEELVIELKIAQRYRRWLYRALCFLQEKNIVEESEGKYKIIKDLPDVDLLSRVEQCEKALISTLNFTPYEARWFTLSATKLIDILREDTHSAEIYTADETTHIYQKLFSDSHKQLQAIIAHVLSLKQLSVPEPSVSKPSFLKKDEPLKKINVLEVGAGLGSATHNILPLLKGHCENYSFTDISQYFLQRARDNFSDYDFLEYDLLNLDYSPHSQGFTAASYDMIIASSMLHDVSNIKSTLNYLKSMLAPRGLLVILEETKFWPSFDLTMGLQQGFDAFDDEDLRQDHPLISRDQWCQLLKTVGFDSALPMNVANTFADYVGFDVIVAQMPDTVAVIDDHKLDDWVLNHLPSYMKPHNYHLLNAFPLTTNGKIDYKVLTKATKKRTHKIKQHQPVTVIQKALHHIWMETLGHNDFGVDQSFFEVGGDSLLLVEVRRKIKKALHKAISTTTLFEYPSIEALSNYLENDKSNAVDMVAIEERIIKQEKVKKNRRDWMKKRVV